MAVLENSFLVDIEVVHHSDTCLAVAAGWGKVHLVVAHMVEVLRGQIMKFNFNFNLYMRG